MNYLKLGLPGVLCLVLLNGFSQSSAEAKKIEKLVAQCVDKAMATSVYIIEYDTLKNKVKEGVEETNGFENTRPRKGMSNFWGKFKNSLIDIFKEEEDHHL